MTQNQFSTESRKDKHLSRDERVIIQEKHRDGWSNREIAKYLGRAPQTINNEIKRGTTIQRRKQTQNGKVYLYESTAYFADKRLTSPIVSTVVAHLSLTNAQRLSLLQTLKCKGEHTLCSHSL